MGAFITTAVLLVLACVSGPAASEETVLLPDSFQLEGYSYCPGTKEMIAVRHDFNGDGQMETLVGFQGYTDDEGSVPASFVMMGTEQDNKIKPMFILRGSDYFDKVELKDIDADGVPEIAFWSGGGAHYTDLDIYKYTDGGIKKIFSNGSACPVEFDDTTGFVRIKIGRERWDKPDWSYASGENLLEVWEWNGKEFQFKPNLSSVKKPLSESEGPQGYIDSYQSENN
ncbi:MAG: hypothetical protein WC552_05305 [Candidatus Omnitrophota bacterium]